MPSDEELVRELRKQMKEEREHREELIRELRRSREADAPPDGMARMRDAYAESDPEAVREERRRKREGRP